MIGAVAERAAGDRKAIPEVASSGMDEVAATASTPGTAAMRSVARAMAAAMSAVRSKRMPFRALSMVRTLCGSSRVRLVAAR